MKLEGVRVIDLSVFLRGPHLTMMMADHGTRVPCHRRGASCSTDAWRLPLCKSSPHYGSR